VLLRERRGEKPTLDEYLTRFPTLADAPREQFAVHGAVQEATPITIHSGERSLESDMRNARSRPDSPPSVVAIPGYEFLGELGRGGMGVVYKARQVSLNRVAAHKMILAGQLAGRDEVTRFRLEAEAAATQDHPGNVPIYEIGEHDCQPFFSLKLLEGGSLAALIPKLKDDPREAARLVSLVARAVHHAHQRGILHRDLKPGNILLDRDGSPHVVDFGLVRRSQAGSGMTQTGAIVGTPGYMPPEQASGRKDQTVTADVYSLGAILYECLTGRPPFRGEKPIETVMQLLEREPERPRAINPKIDADLEAVVLRCLEKERTRRYSSAEGLADDLERWLRGEPVSARAVSGPMRVWRWLRQRPRVIVGLVFGYSSAILLPLAGYFMLGPYVPPLYFLWVSGLLLLFISALFLTMYKDLIPEYQDRTALLVEKFVADYANQSTSTAAAP
jgi:hypothetical protein